MRDPVSENDGLIPFGMDVAVGGEASNVGPPDFAGKDRPVRCPFHQSDVNRFGFASGKSLTVEVDLLTGSFRLLVGFSSGGRAAR